MQVENQEVCLKSIFPGCGVVDYSVLILNKHGLGGFRQI